MTATTDHAALRERTDAATRHYASTMAASIVADLRDAQADAADRLMGVATFATLSPARKRALAHHEAGHAIADLALLPAGSFISVSVQPRASEESLGILRRARGVKAVQTDSDAIRELWCLAAGGVAEEMVTGKRNVRAESDDLQQAHRMLLQAAPTLDGDARIQVIEEQRAAVKSFLESRWSAVEAVAEALQGAGELDYDAVRLLVDATDVHEQLAALVVA